MKINSISNQNFGTLWISANYEGAIKKEIERRKFESFIDTVDKIKSSQDYYIYVEDNGDVYYSTDKVRNADDYRNNPRFAGEDLSTVDKFCYAVSRIDDYCEEQESEDLKQEIAQLKYNYGTLKQWSSRKERYPATF